MLSTSALYLIEHEERKPVSTRPAVQRSMEAIVKERTPMTFFIASERAAANHCGEKFTVDLQTKHPALEDKLPILRTKDLKTTNNEVCIFN